MNQAYRDEQMAFLKKYYGFLKGKVIVEAGVAKGEDEYSGPWPYFVVQDPKTKQKFKIEVSMDGEGNGPGFLFGLPDPK